MISEGMYLPLQIGLYDVVEEPWLNVESSDDQRSGWCRLRHTLRPSYRVVHTQLSTWGSTWVCGVGYAW